jgi:NAD(P)-dependent dehydrogenase (short-subunit alcohol dehydrogenase family)
MKDKVALITGAARGIGRAIALELSRTGAAVVAADIDIAGAQATAETITAENRIAVAIYVDVASRISAARMIEETLARFQHLDILVNNAGVFGTMPALDLTEEEWDRVTTINLKGAFFCSQLAARAMVDGGRTGVIVNMASISADLPEPECLHYGVSKAGVSHLTKSLAVALGPHGIRVIAVAPGTIHTPINDAVLRLPGVVEQRLKTIPLGRIGAPEDVATAVAFLASDKARYVTGSTLYVDGGMMLLR